MARAKSIGKASQSEPKSKPKPKSKPAVAWTDLTWEHLDRWAGARTLQRGRSYQRGGRVRDLATSADGHLLATVIGTRRYATTVALTGTQARPRLESTCTCPVGLSCKHAVAVVAAYLDAVAAGKPVPTAAEDDPRWDDLESGGLDGDDWDDGDPWDEADGEDDEDPDFGPAAIRSRARAPARRAGKATGDDWDAKIERHIRSKPEAELADLVWSLVRRFPELYREFRERIALQEGDADRLVAEARAEIRRVTSQEAWRDSWSGRGSLPDYDPIRHRLERLLELGHADEVASLGLLLIEKGLKQVGESHDEGETASAFASCLPVVFQAVARSSLSGADRLLFAIDADLMDGYDTIGEASAPVLDAPIPPEDWSAVADLLARRLEKEDGRRDGESGADSFLRSYQRDRVSDWLATALTEAGREAELEAVYEAEARATLSYQRLVTFLMQRRRFDDAERWAREGIAATIAQYPGIAAQLAGSLLEVARSRRRWDVVAAHAAVAFFEHPSPTAFDELLKAARKAKVEAPVRQAALRFLETGHMPVRMPPAPRPGPSRPPSKSKSRARATAKSPALRRAEETRPAPVAEAKPEIDPSWPLPMPEYLLPLLSHGRRFDPEPRPRLDVLLRMAIAAKDPDAVLHWYDRMRAEPRRSPYHGDSSAGYAQQVAAAVADAHPERAIAIYRSALDAELPRAEPSAYEAATRLLRTLRPLYRAVGRPGEWDALLASIRESYRNRPRFMEQLERLDNRPIVQSTRPRRR